MITEMRTLAHFNVYNWGLPLTDDAGNPLYKR
jgi:hypothetical protein